MDVELPCMTREIDGHTVLAFVGEIDVHTASELRDRVLDRYRAGHTRLVIDLTGVPFIDSTGLSVLVGALKRIRTAGGSLQIVITDEPVLEVFRVTGLHRLFTIRSSITDAITAGE